MLDFLKQIGAQFQSLWNSWSPATRMMMAGVVVVLLGAIIFTSIVATRPSMNVLFSDLAPEKAGEIASYLREENVPFELQNGGTTVTVPSGREYALRLQIASGATGIRFRSGEVGFEVFDRQPFGMTDKLMDIQYQRALIGELQQTISSSPLVSWSRVQLTLPEEKLFKENEEPPRASIMLKLKSDISSEQVKGIQNLVSSFVEGMKTDDVTVTNANLETLSAPAEPGWVAQLTSTQQKVLQLRQSELREAALQQLQRIVGPGNANVQVALEMDFDQVSETSETLGEPVVEREQESRRDSTRRTVGDVPGVTSNVVDAGTDLDVPGAILSEESEKEITTENKIPIIRQEIQKAPGTITRMTVSALVKSNEWTEEQLGNMEELIKSAVGFNQERDSISLKAFDFAEVEMPAEAPFDRNEAIRVIAPVAGLVLLVLISAVVLFMALRKPQRVQEEQMKGTVEDKQKRTGVPAQGELTAEELGIMDPDSLAALPPDEQRRVRLKEQVVQFANQKPDSVAQIIRTWMSE